ncbi:MAG: HD-GYP domain-containing protein [Gemmatimonadota bacterium]
MTNGKAAAVLPRCVVVDDELGLRQVLGRIMEADGFAAREAASGREALELLDAEPADLLLSDMRMPGMDGIELLKAVRERHPDTAVVLVTAVADVEVAMSCLALGAMDYLTKPFHLEEVRARVSQVMDRRRLAQELRDYQLHLEVRVAEQARRLEEVFLAGVQAVAEALDAKDSSTRGHSVRVAQYAMVLARELGLDERTVAEIELGGHVHDIGKIGVREAVLHKPGALTPEEYAHIMTHPVTGWRILAPLLRDHQIALEVVRSHHERFDGHGLPDRLAGSAIPLAARIAAVADTFDAMTSNRPYRPARDFTDAVAEVARHAGTQFDPVVADALARAVAAGRLLPRPPPPA